MKNYEVMFIMRVEEEEILTKNIEEVKRWILDNSGEIEKVELWGKKHLAYEVQNQSEGYYVLINFKTDVRKTVQELDRRLRLNEFCLRHMIIVLD